MMTSFPVQVVAVIPTSNECTSESIAMKRRHKCYQIFTKAHEETQRLNQIRTKGCLNLYELCFAIEPVIHQ